MIKRSLISVSDKTGLEALVTSLEKLGVDIISTGGTAKAISAANVACQDISDYTGFPEMLDGRVKTLHPKVHGGLLARLDKDEHVSAMQAHDIESIDLVVVNLYPFEETVEKGADRETIIENIDIGGPSMIRSAAKNHAFTTVIVDPNDYAALIEELDNNDGQVSLAFNQKMAAKAFARTAAYDAAISSWFAQDAGELFPETINITAQRKQSLRYGENPHQQAAFYAIRGQEGIATATQLQGKELSFNNINDSNAAIELVGEFTEPTVAIIKHTNPCGLASAASIEEAYDKALASDPVSAFGGIIAINAPLTEKLAEKISDLFLEVVIAPEVESSAQAILAKKKNLRLLKLADIAARAHTQIRSVSGGLLVQEQDTGLVTQADLKIVTKRQPSDAEMADLLFAFRACKHVRSNAILLSKNQATIGIGAGQTSRVDSVKVSIEKAREHQAALLDGATLASDAFFPFPDGLVEAAKAGIKSVIQPGGSIRDEEMIKAADEYDIAMVFTQMRHFKH